MTDKQPRDKSIKKEKNYIEEKSLTEYLLEDDGSIIIDLDVEDESDSYSDTGDYERYRKGHYANLVDEVDEDVLTKLSRKVIADYEQDEQDRSDWLDRIEFGLDLLGLKLEEKQIPFEGACSAQHPLLLESAVKFQSKASNELLPADGPVKTKILGDVTLEREQQALRVKKHLNYQITEQMTEFYPDSEKLLLFVALMGSGFKKTYYNSHLERPVSEFVPADQFVVPNAASDLFRSPRYTHILYKTEAELEADCASGFYQKPETGLGSPSEPQITDVQRKTQELTGVTIGVGEANAVYTLLEQHVMCHIEGLDERGDGEYKLASPYIVTVEKDTGAVLGLRRNWKEGDDEKRIKKVPFTHYGFVPGFGFYCFGFMHLLGNLQLSLTSALRSLVDAGQFANLQGGFKLKGVRIVDDGDPIMPGQFKDIEAVGLDINKSIMSLPFKEPSMVLYQMLEFLDAKGQKFADSTEQVIADSTNYGPVGTTLALLDASTKFFSAIHKRLHAAQKNELKLIADINAETLDEDQIEYNIENETLRISKEDYDSRVDVVPVSDPNISSSAHRMAKAQTVFQIAQQSPELHNMREVLKSVYVDMGYHNVDKILPDKEEATRNDPLTDIRLAVEGKPIKAFEGQDHQGHIAIKQAFLQDPMSGANPQMQKASVAVNTNIQEHMLLSYVEQISSQQQLTGVPLAQAAQQVAMLNQEKLLREQQQQQQQVTPRDQASLILAQAELLDTQTEAKKQEFEEDAKIAELDLEKEKLDLALLKELNKMDEFDKKRLHELQKLVSTKGLDAMIEGLQQEDS